MDDRATRNQPPRASRPGRNMNRPLGYALLTAGAMAAGLLSGMAPAAAAVPATTASPTAAPPATPTAVHPGLLVNATPVTLTPGDYAPDTRAWTIRYRSVSETGAGMTVSGTVVVPKDSGPATPIVAYAPGTLGLGDQCATSRNITSPDNPEKSYVQKYNALGYAVAISDYEGLGTPGPHTYNVGHSEGHAVLDAVRAAWSVPGANLSSAARVAAVGYSQGGFAAGWAAQLAPSYAPDINLTGVSSGAPPADLAANIRYVDGGKYSWEALVALYGQNAAHPELNLDKYLTAKGRTTIAKLATSCVLDWFNDKTLQNHRLSEYTTTDILQLPDWKASINRSVMGTMAPQVPVLLYNSPKDDIVPFGPAVRLRDAWRSRGVHITFYAPEIGMGDHGTTGLNMAGVATGWISARLLGLPDTGSV